MMDQDVIKRFEENETRIKALERFVSKINKKEITSLHQSDKKENDLEKLASEFATSTDKLNEIFDTEDNTLTVLKFNGNDFNEKTQAISLLVIFGYKYLLNQNNILAKELRRNIIENKIPVNNFATYIKEISPSLIRKSGKPSSTKTTYKLTGLGESKARELLHLLITG